jgi:hypothetical protein
VLAESDELQAYPGTLGAVLDDCDRLGYQYLPGCFVGRIARDGGFPPLREGPSLGE